MNIYIYTSPFSLRFFLCSIPRSMLELPSLAEEPHSGLEISAQCQRATYGSRAGRPSNAHSANHAKLIVQNMQSSERKPRKIHSANHAKLIAQTKQSS